jgi:hypothetical protein
LPKRKRHPTARLWTMVSKWSAGMFRTHECTNHEEPEEEEKQEDRHEENKKEQERLAAVVLIH